MSGGLPVGGPKSVDSNGNGAALLSTTSSEFSDCSLQVSHLATGSTLCLTLHTFYIALRLGTSWLCSILSASAGQLSRRMVQMTIILVVCWNTYKLLKQSSHQRR